LGLLPFLKLISSEKRCNKIAGIFIKDMNATHVYLVLCNLQLSPE
jgi:hypothetical protein